MLEIDSKFITKRDSLFLQSATGIKKCDSSIRSATTITKYDRTGGPWVNFC